MAFYWLYYGIDLFGSLKERDIVLVSMYGRVSFACKSGVQRGFLFGVLWV